MFIHQQEEGHGASVGSTFLEVRGDVRVGSIKEEGKEVDDILVGRNLAENLVLILELDTCLQGTKVITKRRLCVYGMIPKV